MEPPYPFPSLKWGSGTIPPVIGSDPHFTKLTQRMAIKRAVTQYAFERLERGRPQEPGANDVRRAPSTLLDGVQDCLPRVGGAGQTGDHRRAVARMTMPIKPLNGKGQPVRAFSDMRTRARIASVADCRRAGLVAQARRWRDSVGGHVSGGHEVAIQLGAAFVISR